MIIPRYANMGRIVGVRSTKQFVGIKVGAFPPDIIILYNENQYQGKKGRNHLTGTCLLFLKKTEHMLDKICCNHCQMHGNMVL